MATVRIEFQTDNAAFEDDPYTETKFVCHRAAQWVGTAINGSTSGTWGLRDSNGNPVGKVTVEE